MILFPRHGLKEPRRQRAKKNAIVLEVQEERMDIGPQQPRQVDRTCLNAQVLSDDVLHGWNGNMIFALRRL